MDCQGPEAEAMKVLDCLSQGFPFFGDPREGSNPNDQSFNAEEQPGKMPPYPVLGGLPETSPPLPCLPIPRGCGS